MARYTFPLVFLAAVALAGCGNFGVPVQGYIQDSDETFQGVAKGMYGSGRLTATSNRGVVCDGAYNYTNFRFGEGVFNCSDGRTGPFKFESEGKKGSGTGTLGNQQFVFTFGE